ncbi:EipB family protein [Ferrovibrio sp.]|uniref:EipB family protein n=1 Tax=Ferrovibrio sp. TaxID=1917215 RepID=UPI0035B2C9D8
MRRMVGVLSFLAGMLPGLVIGLTLGLPGNPTLAANDASSASGPSASSASGPASAIRAEIGRNLASHRAVYALSIARHDVRNYRQGVSGALSLEFLNSCEGYVLNQRFLLEVNTEDGGQVTDMTLGSFESRDGKRFQFRMREQVDGDDEEELVGEGRVAANGGKITFSQPDDNELLLPPGAMFPTEHTIRLIEAARAGVNTLQADVFDGSSVDGYAAIGGFIGRTRTAPAEGQPGVDGRADGPAKPLAGLRYWQVRLGYFNSAKKSDVPDYEIAFRLFENGVSDDIVFDYGDYAIRATLQHLEMLPKDGC